MLTIIGVKGLGLALAGSRRAGREGTRCPGATWTFDAFVADDTLRRAFVRSLEIIGEAAKNVPDEVQTHIPELRRQISSILDT